MTTRRQILNLLNGNAFPYSDNGMARVLDRPTPSIRRLRISMERDGLITQANGNMPYEWSLTMAGRAAARETTV